MSSDLKSRINLLTNKLIGVSSYSEFEIQPHSAISSLLQECIEENEVNPVHDEVMNCINEAILDVFSKNTVLESGLETISSQLEFNQGSLQNIKSYLSAVIDARSFATDHPGEINPHISTAIAHGDAIANDIGAGIIQKAKSYAGYGRGKLRTLRDKPSDSSSLSSTSNLDGQYKFDPDLVLLNLNPDIAVPSFSRTNPQDLGTFYVHSGVNKNKGSSSRPFVFKDPINIHFDFSNASTVNPWKTLRTRKDADIHMFEVQIDLKQKVKGVNTIDFSNYPSQTVDFHLSGELNFEGSPDGTVPPLSLKAFERDGNIDYRQVKMGLQQKLTKMTMKSFFTDLVHSKESSETYYIGIQVVLERSDKINPYLFWISKIVITGTQSNVSGFLATEISDSPESIDVTIPNSEGRLIHSVKFVPNDKFNINDYNSSAYMGHEHQSIIREPEKKMSLSFKVNNGSDMYFISTQTRSPTDASHSIALKRKADETLIFMHWLNPKVYKNLKDAYRIKLSMPSTGYISFEFTFSYYPEKHPDRGHASHGSFFRNLKFYCAFAGFRHVVPSGWLAVIVDFPPDDILKKKYEFGLLLLINIESVPEDGSLFDVNQIIMLKIISAPLRQIIRGALFSPKSGAIGGLFSTIYKKMRGKKREPINPIVPEIAGSPYTTHAHDFSSSSEMDSTTTQPSSSSDTSRFTSSSTKSIQSQSSSMFDTSRLTTWSATSNDRAPLILLDPYSSASREIFAISRTAQTDVYSRESTMGIPPFLPPKSINYIKFVNGAMVSSKSLKYNSPELVYELSGIENANPEAVCEIDFTASEEDEKYEIMRRWVWYENDDGSQLVIIPRPPFDLSMWAFNFTSALKIDTELSINGVSYSLRSMFVQTNGGDISGKKVLRFSPIKNKVISFVLDNTQLKTIVIQHDNNIILPIVPPLTPLSSLSSTSSSTSESSPSRSWRLMRFNTSKQNTPRVTKQTLVTTDNTIHNLVVYNAHDPIFDEYLQKLHLLMTEKMKPSAVPSKWIKSFSFVDQKPDFVVNHPMVTTFSIDFSSFSEVQKGKQQWIWAQENIGTKDMNKIFVVPKRDYHPLIFFENINNVDSFDPHTWKVAIEYPSGTRHLETHVFDLPPEYKNRNEVIVGANLHNSIRMFIYLHPNPGQSQSSITYVIYGIVLENTNVFRSLPSTSTLSPRVEVVDPKNVQTSSNGPKFHPAHVARITNPKPGMLRLPSKQQLPQKPPASMVLSSPESKPLIDFEEPTEEEKDFPPIPLELSDESFTSTSDKQPSTSSSSSSFSKTSSLESKDSPSVPFDEMPMFYSSTSDLPALKYSSPQQSPSPSSSSSIKTSQVMSETSEIEKKIEDPIGEVIEDNDTFSSDFDFNSDSLDEFL